MKRALLITYSFSPQATPESILSAKLFANMKNLKTDVVTIKQPIPGTIDLDASLENYIDKYFEKIYRCNLNRIFKLLSLLNLKKIIPFPDYFRILNNSIYNYIIKNIDVKSYDYVITWSQSHSIHLVGLRLKKKYKLENWITYFSDPWADNPFFNKSYFGLEKFLNILNEKKVFVESKKIICTSNETKELMGNKYNKTIRDKIYVIPHCFDRRLYGKDNHLINNQNKKKMNFRYIGKFYGKRFPKVLIDALIIIEKSRKDIFDKINFQVFGSQNFLVLAKIYKYRKYIQYVGPLSYSKSLKIMQQADYLLVIDAPFANSVFFPSKLVDYMGSNRDVIGITPNGTARDIINKMGGYTFSHNDPKKLSEELMNLFEKSFPKNSLDKNFINNFSSDQVAKRFQNVLEI